MTYLWSLGQRRPSLPCSLPVPKELPPEQRRSSLLHVRFTAGELARLDAYVAALNDRADGDGAEVKRAAWVRRAVMRALRRAEERLQNPGRRSTND